MSVLVTLLAIVMSLQWLERQPVAASLFHYLPAAFWCYFIPVMLASAGLLPAQSPVYTFLTTYVLAACLLLLLLNIRLPAIMKLGPTALGTMCVGALGIALGAVAAWGLWARWLPQDTWKGIGALSASWIGGSANMIAVKEALATPDPIFAPMVILDTLVSYGWMAFLISLAPWQSRWDAWVKADRSTLEDVTQRLQRTASDSKPSWQTVIGPGTLVFAGAMVVGALCLKVGSWMPVIGNGFNATGWSFLFVTLLGILLSLTPASELERYGASRWGTFALYLLLAAIGAKARIQDIVRIPQILLMGATWIGFHGCLLALYGWRKRIPLFFLVTASQANIGGTASAPIVAGVFQPALAPLGLLLAIIGNVIGTYAGLGIAAACRAVHP